MQTDKELATPSPPSVEFSQQQQTILYCLDFDGVLCDSVHETFLSGWRACKLLWSKKKMKHNSSIDISGTNDDIHWIDAIEGDPQRMNQLEEDFRFVRPILYVGWEAILLIRLLAVGYRDEIAGTSLDATNPSDISTRDAVFRGFHQQQQQQQQQQQHGGTASSNNDNNEKFAAVASTSRGFRDHALEAWGVSAADYKAAMSEARNTWIQEDEDSWINAHGFYGGACQVVREYLNAKGNEDIYIITTKGKEFALRLLGKKNLFRSSNSNNVAAGESWIQESHVFGLGSGPKASVLQQILEKREIKIECEREREFEFVAVMVEDNIATLDKISKSPVRNQVLPVVASWGYNSIEQLVGVLLATANSDSSSTSNNNNNRESYVVLPLLEEFSINTLTKARDAAIMGKQRDPTGCSMASIFQNPSDAGNPLLPLLLSSTSLDDCQRMSLGEPKVAASV